MWVPHILKYIKYFSFDLNLTYKISSKYYKSKEKETFTITML